MNLQCIKSVAQITYQWSLDYTEVDGETLAKH